MMIRDMILLRGEKEKHHSEILIKAEYSCSLPLVSLCKKKILYIIYMQLMSMTVIITENNNTKNQNNIVTYSFISAGKVSVEKTHPLFMYFPKSEESLHSRHQHHHYHQQQQRYIITIIVIIIRIVKANQTRLPLSSLKN